MINRLYKKKDNGVLLYRIPSKPEQMIRKMSHFSLFRPPIKENIEFLKNLNREENRYFLISSRFGFLKNATEKIVRKHDFDQHFAAMYFNYENKQPHLFKNEILQQLGLDAYIDDDLSLLKFVSRDNPKTQFYWYNKKNNGTITDNIRGITHLNDIFPLMHRYEHTTA